MDLGAAITGIVIIVICIVPFVVMSINNNNKRKRTLQSLKDMAAENGGSIVEHDFWGSSVIGLSENGKFVYGVRKSRADTKTFQVNLQETLKCKLSNISRTIKNDSGNAVIVDKLELVMTNRKKERPDTIIEFYNSDYDVNLSVELQLAEKWCKIINDRIALIA